MPRVDRVIFALTANPLYSGFWPYVAEIWARKFNVSPTLMFYGTRDEYDAFGEKTCGTVLHLERVPSVTVNPQRDWACTWGLFYGATLFPDDVCILSGLDQVPLSGFCFDLFKPIPTNRYIVGFSDAYGNPHNPSTHFPSSHHVALGSKFKEVFDIKDDWKTEVEQVFAARSRYTLASDVWGLDEAYSSDVIQRRVAQGQNDVVFVKGFDNFQNRRLWRGKDALAKLDFDGIRRGQYTEWHADRPFEVNDPAFLTRLKDSIPTVTQ